MENALRIAGKATLSMQICLTLFFLLACFLIHRKDQCLQNPFLMHGYTDLQKASMAQ
jgi:hypothetical protein